MIICGQARALIPWCPSVSHLPAHLPQPHRRGMQMAALTLPVPRSSALPHSALPHHHVQLTFYFEKGLTNWWVPGNRILTSPQIIIQIKDQNCAKVIGTLKPNSDQS